MSKTLVAGWLTDGPGRLERQRVRAGAAVKETTAAASGSWGERERAGAREERRDGCAEEAGEQVQGAGRQAAAGPDPTPNSSLSLPRCGSVFPAKGLFG
jgi:hypothetical protein